jgi:hypothetical protein
MNTPLRNDAAPLARGVGVDRPNISIEALLTGLPLNPSAHHNASAGIPSIAADQLAGHAKHLRARVLAFIVEQGTHGATDDKGEATLGIKCSMYTARRGGLVKLRLVVDSRRGRNTASGRPAAVWVTPNHALYTPTPEGGAA